MTISLNTFLRKLPELVVDNLTFKREYFDSEYFLVDGVWKLHKIGYNEYRANNANTSWTWHSDIGAGDLHIQEVRTSITGVVVILGDDVNTNGD